MALVLSKQAIGAAVQQRLIDAVQRFEDALDADQKKAFAASRTQKVSDDAHAAIAFTTDIGLRSGSGLAQQLGPRFEKVLSSIRVLTSLADAVVSGSQNLIAGAVWGVVKTALESASRVLSFYEKLSELFVDLGKHCPDVQGLTAIFPEDEGLHVAIAEYLTTMTDMCRAIVTFAAKSRMKRLAITLTQSFQTQFGTYQHQLRRWSETIRDRAMMASFRLQRQEKDDRDKEKSRSFAISKPFKIGTTKRQRLELELSMKHRRERMKAKLLDACTKHNPYATWKQLRKQGNTAWILQNSSYHSWKLADCSSNLQCVGHLGSGKSVLAANVIGDILASKATNDILAFHFCRYDDSKSLERRTIAGSIARQILMTIVSNEVWDNIQTADIASCHDDPLGFVLRLLHEMRCRGNALEKGGKTHQLFIVLDGIDECDTNVLEWRNYLQELDIHPSTLVKTLICARKSPRHSVWPDSDVIDIESQRPSEELSEYVIQQLRRNLESGRLKLSRPEMILLIRDTLVERSNGMFLWLALQLSELNLYTSDAEIVAGLDDLPVDLSAAYERILNRAIPSTSPQPYRLTKISRLLRILAVARQPITSSQCKEALGVKIGVIDNDLREMRDTDVESIVTNLNGLLIIDEEEDTVQFCHQTVLQHLSTATTDWRRIDMEQAEQLLAAICITYLHHDGLREAEKQLTKKIQAKFDSNRVLENSLSAALDNRPRRVANAAMQLLESRAVASYDLMQSLREMVPEVQRAPDKSFHLLSYAKEHWKPHSRHFRYVVRLQDLDNFNFGKCPVHRHGLCSDDSENPRQLWDFLSALVLEDWQNNTEDVGNLIKDFGCLELTILKAVEQHKVLELLILFDAWIKSNSHAALMILLCIVDETCFEWLMLTKHERDLRKRLLPWIDELSDKLICRFLCSRDPALRPEKYYARIPTQWIDLEEDTISYSHDIPWQRHIRSLLEISLSVRSEPTSAWQQILGWNLSLPNYRANSPDHEFEDSYYLAFMYLLKRSTCGNLLDAGSLLPSVDHQWVKSMFPLRHHTGSEMLKDPMILAFLLHREPMFKRLLRSQELTKRKFESVIDWPESMVWDREKEELDQSPRIILWFEFVIFFLASSPLQRDMVEDLSRLDSRGILRAHWYKLPARARQRDEICDLLGSLIITPHYSSNKKME